MTDKREYCKGSAQDRGEDLSYFNWFTDLCNYSSDVLELCLSFSLQRSCRRWTLGEVVVAGVRRGATVLAYPACEQLLPPPDLALTSKHRPPHRM